MTRDPIRRRFGHGAGRLPLGLPPGSERLSEGARRPVQHERRLTLVLPLVAAVVGASVVSALQPARKPMPPAAGVIQIVLDEAARDPLPVPLPEPALPVPAPATQTPRTARPAPATLARRAPPSPAVPIAAERMPAPVADFDPSALATRGPAWSDEAILPAPHAAGGAGPRLPKSAPLAPARAARAMPAGLADAGHAPAAIPASDAIASGPRGLAAATGRRPGAATEGARGDAGFVADGSGSGDRERSDFLAALARAEGDSARGSNGAAPASRRPIVSAAPAAPTALASGSDPNGVDGWQEVPLDALPDCDPPGRQDLLKKRILLAASFERECTHRGGSFRFVETRNLGAFLMWSRPIPAGSAGQPRDRDACDVLERALACLGDPSSQESRPR